MTGILLTGVTGVVGPSVAQRLQQLGYTIYYLIRSDKISVEPADRLKKALPEVRAGCDLVLQGDVTKPLCGISLDTIKNLSGRIQKVAHVAASIKFSRSAGNEVWNTNLLGTINVSNLAKALGIHEFYFVSTIYVSGTAIQFTEADSCVNQAFRNAYEESKLAAEEFLVKHWGDLLSRFRLGIVCGDSDTGAIPSFSGYYGFFKGFHTVLQAIKQGWMDADTRKKLLHQSIKFNRKGKLMLPLFIDASKSSRLSLVRRDWCAETMSKLIQQRPTGQAYHLVPTDPPLVMWVIKASLDYLGINGVKIGDGTQIDDCNNPLLTSMQTQVRAAMKQYYGYIQHEADFGHENLERDLGSAYVPHPVIDKEYLKVILDYAISKNFGIVQ